MQPARHYSLLRLITRPSDKRLVLHIDNVSHDTLQGALDEAFADHIAYHDDSLVSIVSTDDYGNSRHEMNKVEIADYCQTRDNEQHYVNPVWDDIRNISEQQRSS